MFDIKAYDASQQELWDLIVAGSRTPFFQFHRSYMEYHSDRFLDASMICFCDGVASALLPGNVSGDTYYSHQGLTFGGLVNMPERLRASDVLKLFEQLAERLRRDGLKKLVYKAIPLIYHATPSQEDVYALARLGAMTARVELTTTIDYRAPLALSSRRRRGIRKAKKAGLDFQESADWNGFWQILADRLRDRHGVAPVHSVDEIRLLASRLPQNIRLFVASREGRPVAGTVIYESPYVAHCQYISSSTEGLDLGALDGLFDYLIAHYSPSKRYFDFGISTEEAGRVLNEGLVRQKEEFGGGGVVHTTFELAL